MRPSFGNVLLIQIAFSAVVSSFLTGLSWAAKAIITEIVKDFYPKAQPGLEKFFKTSVLDIPIVILLLILFLSITVIVLFFLAYRYFRAHKDSDNYLQIYESYLTNLSEHLILPHRVRRHRLLRN